MTEEVNIDQVNADEKYYEAFLDLFGTDGWKNLVVEMTANQTNLDQALTIDTAEELWTRKGQLTILGNMINLETSVRFALDQIAENDDEDN